MNAGNKNLIFSFFPHSKETLEARIAFELTKGPKKEYSPEIRKFALTIRYYSKACYKFIRDTFDRSLPCTSTIQGWYRAIDC